MIVGGNTSRCGGRPSGCSLESRAYIASKQGNVIGGSSDDAHVEASRPLYRSNVTHAGSTAIAPANAAIPQSQRSG
jgi:hypothetical protein